MIGVRSDPEQLLQRSIQEEHAARYGKLRIYLGAAPGVGKTYAMLHDAMQLRDDKLDVVVGIAESHGRKEIEELLKDFEIIPRQVVSYRGTSCLEFDLDIALKRSPGLILIDEIAHSNVPGLRHAKRWQDIKEFLDRGIDVYTTLNVQHIESLKDDVAQIIQAPVHETVPDFMIERAHTIAVVDLSPEDLLKRLQDGKVYLPQQAELATEHFFRKGNLIALRELALRATAARVGSDVLLYRQSEGIKHIWPTRAKILVCVGPGSESLQLIRIAKRMARSLQAEWLAIYVDIPQRHAEESLRNSAIANLHLAEQFGAITHVLTGLDVIDEIIEFAKEQNITQIMICKNISMRWRNWFRRSLADRLIRRSDEIDVYIMTTAHQAEILLKKNLEKKIKIWKVYGMAILTIVIATLSSLLLAPLASSALMVYLLGLVVIARFGYIGLSTWASIISALIYDFLFVQPYYSLSIFSIGSILSLAAMLVVAQLISYLTILNRRQEQAARLIHAQTTALYALSHKLTYVRGLDNLVSLSINYIADAFNCTAMILMLKKDDLVIMHTDVSLQNLDVKEHSIAQWVYEMKQVAGFGTDTLSFSKALFLPMIGAEGAIGVLRIEPKVPKSFSPEQIILLESCVHQIALALEVDRMYERVVFRKLKSKAELARITLLDLISHDLNKPLNTIINAVSTLDTHSDNAVKALGRSINHDILKLSQLNNNIIQIIQLEHQDFNIQKSISSLNLIIDFVVKLLACDIYKRSIYIHIPKNLPLISLNEELIRQVIINLLDNAIKFTPLNSVINIKVWLEKTEVMMSVEDNGVGIRMDEKDKLFEKFYRSKQLIGVHGLGLGLAICHKIILAHDGRIWVENLKGGGAAFSFSLPLDKIN